MLVGELIAAAKAANSTGLDERDSENTWPRYFLSVWGGKKEDVDKIAEMDMRWEEDSLFNTGWHFPGRDEVKATISS